MAVLGHLFRLLTRGLRWVGTQCLRLSDFFNGLLPALLSPPQLTRLVRDYYLPIYRDGTVPQNLHLDRYLLEPWETDVLTRYRVDMGRMLVVGSGWGREALAVARRGATVIGADVNAVAVRAAQQMAQAGRLPAYFHQADFMALPYAPASFDYILLSGTMYSAVQGTAQRQAWLADLGCLLKQGGLIILSFAPEQRKNSRLKALCTKLNMVLVRLPSANTAYQVGDECYAGHFIHAFQSIEEFQTEIESAGALIKEIDWSSGYAVATFPPPAGQRT